MPNSIESFFTLGTVGNGEEGQHDVRVLVQIKYVMKHDLSPLHVDR